VDRETQEDQQHLLVGDFLFSERERKWRVCKKGIGNGNGERKKEQRGISVSNSSSIYEY